MLVSLWVITPPFRGITCLGLIEAPDMKWGTAAGNPNDSEALLASASLKLRATLDRIKRRLGFRGITCLGLIEARARSANSGSFSGFRGITCLGLIEACLR